MVEPSKFKDLFLSEAEDHLQKLNANFLKLEKNPKDQSILGELMRSSHTLKSSSAIMGYKNIAFLMHVMEDVFDYAKNDILKISPEVANSVFHSFDALAKSLKILKKSDKEPVKEAGIDVAAEKLKEIAGVATEGSGKSLRQADGQPIAKSKSNAGPANNSPAVPEAFSTVDFDKISYIKVPIERLDSLMALMEELVVEKMRLDQLRRDRPETEDLVNHLNSLIFNVRYQIMQARMVSVEHIFSRFPRMVRDLAQQQNKQIELEISGSEMELDRTIIDKLAEPITHLLRNSIDHGVKTAGKIFIRAKRGKDNAIIEIEDDGEGIDIEKVKEVAIRKNIISSKQSSSLSKNQIFELLYNSQFSTNDKVSQISGRGIGLSVVRTFVGQVGGRSTIESPAPSGRGTLIILELPLTLAIINSLIVQVKNSFFAIPFPDVERIVTARREEIRSMADQDVAVIEEAHIPLVRLEKIFGLSGGEENGGDLTLVVVRRGRDLAGLVVDKLIDKKEIIVKPFSPVLGKIKGFSGSSILGDGKSILILDAASLLEDTAKLVRS